jgi:pimeloyl-ACP methyl ester carboxylesterase
VIVGFLGGRDAWNDKTKGVRQVGLSLTDPARNWYAETFENRRRNVAEKFVVEALDGNGDGHLDTDESSRATLVVFGQSFGGAATTKFAWRLNELGLPVFLTLQIDSVGRGDGKIPPNVRYAANLYQVDGWIISGENPIRATAPSRTRIIGNWRFDYSQPPGSDISLEDLPWYKIAFRAAHAKMDRDPRVWALVDDLIRAACRSDELERVVIGPKK